MFHQILPDALVQAGGWTILHSLWQGAVITLLLAFILGRTRDHSPVFRYNLSVGALFLMLAAVVSTFMMYYEPATGLSVNLSAAGATAGGTLAAELPATASMQNDLAGRFFPFLLQVWLIGVALMGLRMLVELVYLQRLRSANTRPIEASWQERMNALKWQMGILQPVVLRESLRVSSPMLVGWIKPVILLPIGMLSGLSTEQVACILAHELAHVRRLDYLVNLIQSALEVLLFFNPAVWWISAQIREEREHCCDELAVSVTGDRLTLVKTLAQLEEWRMQSGQLGLAFNGRPQGVLGRVQRLLGGESSVRIIGKGLWSLLFFCMATGLLAFQDQDESADLNQPWENIGILDTKPDQPTKATARPVSPAPENESVSPRDIVSAPTSSERLVPTANPVLADRIRERQMAALSALPNASIVFLRMQSDTIPKEKVQEQMQELQLAMEKLQQKMMNSEEMKRMQELTKAYEIEMQTIQEKLMKEHGGMEAVMQERQKMMQEVEQRHQELMESEAFKSMHQEMEKVSREYTQLADELKNRFKNDPQMLEMKLDSLSRIYEGRHEAFEKKYEEAFSAIEKEMQDIENSPEMKDLEKTMQALDRQMEQLMKAKFEPMEVEMEKLQEILDKRFETEMKVLEEQMEKLERLYRNRNERREE